MLENMPKKPNYPQHELAERLRAAMEEAGLSQADLARACHVTIQAVHDWRETGRIGKQHLGTICQLTKKPFEYFLVGLSRAAVVTVVTFFTILQPQPALASVLHNVYSEYALWQRRLAVWLGLEPVVT